MAITLNTGLPDVALVGMPAKLDLHTDARLISAGSAAEIEIQFGDSRGVSDAFELRYNGLVLSFTFAGDDGSGFNFDTFSDNLGFNDFANAFFANFYIARDFDATITANSPADRKIRLVAKQNGSAYNVIMVPLYTGSTETPGVDDEYAQNFEVLAQIHARIDNVWKLLTMVKGAVDADTEDFSIFVHGVLKELLGSTLPAFNFGNFNSDNFAGKLDGHVQAWYARVYEQWGDPPLIRNPYNFGSEAAPKFAIDFAVSKQIFPKQASWFNAISGSNRILLNNRVNMLAHKSQYVYLNVLVPEFVSGSANSNTDITIKRVGLSDVTITTTKPLSPDEWEMWYFAVSIPYILSVHPTAYAIEVVVKGLFTPTWTCEKATITLDKADYEYVHHFLYRNRRGGWESVYFTGHLRSGKGYSSELAELEAEHYDMDSQGYSYNHNVQSEYILNTGFKNAAERAELANFADSDEVYWLNGTYGTAEGEWVKVLVDAKGFAKLDDTFEDDAQEMEFGFRLAKRDF